MSQMSIRIQTEKYPGKQVSKSVQCKSILKKNIQVSKSVQCKKNVEQKNQVSKCVQPQNNPEQKQVSRRACWTA